MTTLLLTMLYLSGTGLIVLLSIGCGSLFMPPIAKTRLAERLLGVCLRYCLGVVT